MPATAPRGVNLVGSLGTGDGAGQVVRQLSRALDVAGIEQALISEREPPPDPPFDCTLLCLNPDRMPAFAARAGPGFFAGRRTAGLWCWEADLFPAGLAWAFDYVDEVWTYSEFIRAALAPLASVPVERFTMPIDPEPPSRTDPAALGLPQGFVFLFVFECLSAARKNPLGLVEAFASGFAPGDGAQLVLKTWNCERNPGAADELRRAAAAHRHVHLIDRPLPEGEKNGLIAASDCYVSLHRSEGLGLTIAEAMFFGLPVIATGWSGSLELTDERNSYLVDYRLRPVGREAWPYRPIGHWAEPDLDHAAKLMREVFDDPEEAAARGRRAGEELRSGHSPEATARGLAERVDELAERPPRAPDAPLPDSTSQRARRLVERGPPASVAALSTRCGESAAASCGCFGPTPRTSTTSTSSC